MPEKELLESEEKLPPNVKVVETEKAKFRIAYGVHTVEQKPEDLGEVDALMLESGSFDYTSSKERVENLFADKIRHYAQYRKIIKRAEKKEKPIFLGDITEEDAVTALQMGLKLLEPIMGVWVLASLLRSGELILPAEIATGYLLSETSAVGIVDGIILGTKIRDYLFGEKNPSVDKKSFSRAVERFLGDLNERIHPETNTILVTLRNNLMAQKLKTVSEKLEIQNRKPEVGISIGEYHHGIEKALKKDDEERVKLVDKLLNVPGLKKTREKIATIAKFDFNKEEDKWELTDRFKDPHLAKIEK